MRELPILPEQFFDLQRPPVSGEMRLLMAMLEDALRQEFRYRKVVGLGGRRSTRLYRELREWFLSDEHCWGSFRFICHTLGIDHDAAVDEMRARFNSPPVQLPTRVRGSQRDRMKRTPFCFPTPWGQGSNELHADSVST